MPEESVRLCADEPNDSGLERAGFGALVALLLAPVLAHGLWRPLVHVFGPAGSAGRVTASALAIGAVVALVRHLRPAGPPWRPLLLGGLLAVGASLGSSLGLAGLVTLLAVAGALAGLVPWLSSRLPAAFDGLAARHKVLTTLYLVVALASVASVARLSIFIGDPSRSDLTMLPGDRFVETHSCLTAYARAISLARRGVDNLYADHWWYGSNGLPPMPAGDAPPYPPFSLDNFSYPPAFLLVAASLAPLEGDFAAQRALWFGLNGLWLAVGLWVVARFIDGPRAHRVLLLAPLFFGSLPILITLQIGNFQLAAVTFALVAMVALERGRAATGGALFALTILAKISPGILGVVLLAQRRFRDAALTAAFGVVLLALAVLLFGRDPMVSFVTYALPRLNSGAAFPFMDTPSGILTNQSPFGVVFKLRLLGLDVGDPWRLAPRIAHAYTLALVLLATLAARRPGDRRERAVTWMSLLVLSALQSPFCPAYATLGLLWATTLLAVEVRRLLGAMGLIALWLMILVVPPWLSVEVRVVQSMVQTAVILGVCGWLVARAPRGPDASSPAPVS